METRLQWFRAGIEKKRSSRRTKTVGMTSNYNFHWIKYFSFIIKLQQIQRQATGYSYQLPTKSAELFKYLTENTECFKLQGNQNITANKEKPDVNGFPIQPNIKM